MDTVKIKLLFMVIIIFLPTLSSGKEINEEFQLLEKYLVSRNKTERKTASEVIMKLPNKIKSEYIKNTEATIRNLAKTLPQKIDKVLTFRSVTIFSQGATFTYTLKLNERELLDFNSNFSEYKNKVINEICSNWYLAIYLIFGKKYTKVYELENGDYIGTVVVDWETCGSRKPVGKDDSMVKQKEKTKVTALIKEANLGSADAQYKLAVMYENIYNDKKAAIKWYKKAAEQGHSSAQFNLGLIYYYGEPSTEKRKNKAIELFKSSASKKNDDAITILYMIGVSTNLEFSKKGKRDLSKDFELLKKYLISEKKNERDIAFNIISKMPIYIKKSLAIFIEGFYRKQAKLLPQTLDEKTILTSIIIHPGGVMMLYEVDLNQQEINNFLSKKSSIQFKKKMIMQLCTNAIAPIYFALGKNIARDYALKDGRNLKKFSVDWKQCNSR